MAFVSSFSDQRYFYKCMIVAQKDDIINIIKYYKGELSLENLFLICKRALEAVVEERDYRLLRMLSQDNRFAISSMIISDEAKMRGIQFPHDVVSTIKRYERCFDSAADDC